MTIFSKLLFFPEHFILQSKLIFLSTFFFLALPYFSHGVACWAKQSKEEKEKEKKKEEVGEKEKEERKKETAGGGGAKKQLLFGILDLGLHSSC